MYTLTDLSRITKLEAFLRENTDKSIGLLYDDDADGVTSGVFIKAALAKLGFSNILTCPKSDDRRTFTGDFLNKLEATGIDIILAVDFEPISWKFIDEKKLSQLPFDIVIIDHHYDHTQTYDDCQSDRLRLFIHPLNSSDTENPSQYCCAKFSYDIFSTMVDLSEHSWKQSVGLIGDMNIIQWPDFTKALLKKSGTIVTEPKDYFTSPEGRISAIIGFASSQNSDEVEEFYDEYFAAKKPEELLHFEKRYEQIAREYHDVIINWEKFATFDSENQIYFVKLQLKNLLTSVVSSVISYMNPEFTFIFYQHNGGRSFHISARSQQTKAHLGHLMKHVSESFQNSRGGGHAPAAGAICLEQDADAFMQKVKDSFAKFKT